MTLARAGAQLLALTSFALAQPLLDLLGRNPEFFAVRGTSGTELTLFALAVVLVPPAALLGLEALAGLGGERARAAVHLVLVGALAGSFVLGALRRLDAHPLVPLALAAGAGGLAVVAFRGAAPVRAGLTLLGAAGVLFLALFLANSRAADLVFSTPETAAATGAVARRPAPVVLLILDELPTASLLDARGRIDPVRFPGLAGLARSSVWYRNATTVHESTARAVPAILTGRVSRGRRLPVLRNHPQNLFTLLAGYDVHGFEVGSRLCPARVCGSRSLSGQLASLISDAAAVSAHLLLPERLARRLPPVSESWQGFLGGSDDEPARVERFLRSLRPGPRPGLHVLHLLLPHSPWRFLPDGRTYGVQYPEPPWGRTEFWTEDEAIVLQGRQRHLLQTAYVDRQVGRIVARLRETGLYDRALVVVLADHGIHFGAGEKRRPAWPANLHDIAFVPLLVKLPGQRRGRVVDRPVRTVDVVPTVAAVVGARVGRLDGRSLLAGGSGTGTVLLLKDSGRPLSAPLAALERRRARTVAEQVALTGANEPPAGLFAMGPLRRLLGRRVEALETARSARLDRIPSSEWQVGVRVGGAGVRAVGAAVAGRVVAVAPVVDRQAWLLLPRPARHVRLLALPSEHGS